MSDLTTQEKTDRLWDMHEIRNLMGKYTYYHNAHEHQYTVNLFALDAAGVRVENDSLGIFEGAEGIRKFFYDFHTYMDGDRLGSFNIHTLTSEVLEVARDGQTAKGVWMSPGVETRRDNSGQLRSYWCWGKYAVDFIRQDGQWKFWHFMITTELFCDYYQSWVDYSPTISERKLPVSDQPSRFGAVLYNTGSVARLIPVPPEPYDSYSQDTFYQNISEPNQPER